MLARGPSKLFTEWPRCNPGAQKPRVPAGSPLLFCLFSGLGHASISCSRGRLAVAVGAYTRIPMETAGAYQLIDEETGEKVIVWGGADDGPESPVPSKDVLSWKPGGESPGSRGAGGDEGHRQRRPVGTVGSFGKLKVQRVKALMRSKKKPAPQIGAEINVSNDDGGGHDMDAGPDVDFAAKAAASSGYSEDGTGQSRFLSVLQRQQPAPVGDENVQRGGGSGSSLRGWNDARSSSATKGDGVNSTSHLKKQRRSVLDNDGRFFSRMTFKELGCSDDIMMCLSKLQFHRPSHIQAMSYVPLLEGKSCIIADQSGSGKTLAYLAPTIQCLRQEELLGLGKSSSGSPRVLILVPTAELATQVLNNCRLIAKSGIPFRSMVATGGFRQKTQLESLQQEVDVLIATPGRFLFLLQEGFLQLANLKCAVLDEVDILFGDEDFEQVLRSLMNSALVMTQYLFATATLPVDIYNKLVEIFPDCEVIMGPGMHRTSSGLEEVLVDCSGNDGEEKSPDTAFFNKKSALLKLVEETPVSRTVVFCNKIETCRKVENILKRFDRKGHRIKVLPFHAALDQEIRLSNMREFLGSQSNDSLFFICTDRASRGIDFANVDHVLLFDFPRDPSEYIRRVGRTARGAGGKGKAFVFVVGKQVSLARRIMERNQKGHPLHDLPSA